MTREIRTALELRESDTSPGRLVGVLLEMGRVAGDRREIFTPSSVRWPSNGIRLLAEHRGRLVRRFEPVVEGSQIRVDVDLPDTEIGREVATEIRAGRRRGLSVEFYAVEESRVSGVREIRGALVDAVAVVPSPAYDQARVEVRGRRRRVWL